MTYFADFCLDTLGTPLSNPNRPNNPDSPDFWNIYQAFDIKGYSVPKYYLANRLPLTYDNTNSPSNPAQADANGKKRKRRITEGQMIKNKLSKCFNCGSSQHRLNDCGMFIH